MPATDWREITFSTQHLRPGDGYDPEARLERKEAKELSKKKSIPLYIRASTLAEDAEAREQKNKEKLVADELARQSKERENLAEAIKMRETQFEELWAHKRKEMEHEVAEKRRGFEEKVEGETNGLELQIEQKAKKNMKLYFTSKHPQYPPVIYSSIVRDDGIIETKQAQALNFDLAIRYNNSLKNQRDLEQRKHVENCEHLLNHRRKVLREK